MRRALVLVLVAALLVSSVAVAPAAGETTQPTIVRTMSFSLTPSEPGSVDVQVTYDIPSNVVSLSTTIPDGVTVESSSGFTAESGGNYSWDGRPQRPSLTFALPANRTGIGFKATEPSSGYEFVDPGPWAIVAIPPMSTAWSYHGDAPRLERRTRTATDGVAGTKMVYLGPSTEYRRTANGQTFTLVVPDRSSLAPDPNDVLDSLADASSRFRVGERDPSVLFIAAPTSVDWAAEGLASDADAWVKADRRLNDPNDVWLHEYVHTRTSFVPTTDAQWLTEASAEYYAALLTLQQGRITFTEFHDHLARGSRPPYESSIMTRPSTWYQGANYLKGGLVLGSLDRRMRLATGSSHPASDVIAAMNAHDGPVSYSFVRSTVVGYAGSDTARYLDTDATTRSAPEMWTREQHADAFDTNPPAMVVGTNATYGISGPYRTTSVSSPSRLVTGETLTVNTSVTNEGDVTGEYDVPLLVDGTPVARATGTLDGGATTAISLGTTFDSVGTHTVSVGEQSVTVTVDDPATPRVTGLSTNVTTIDPGGSVAVTVTADNPDDRPARGPIPIVVDGQTSATWTPTIDAGGSASTVRTLRFQGAGTHTIEAGDQRVTVTVSGPSIPTPPIPGFSPLDALLALVLAGTLVLLRRARG